MKSALDLTQCLDADVWAKTFIRNVKEGTVDPADLDTVRAWFANAIMAGYDHGRPVNGDHAAYLIDKESGSSCHDGRDA